jgi:hypothetical protein
VERVLGWTDGLKDDPGRPEKKGEEEGKKPEEKERESSTYQGKKRQGVLWLYAGRVWMQCPHLERLLETCQRRACYWTKQRA